jgi:hypothetical protein
MSDKLQSDIPIGVKSDSSHKQGVIAVLSLDLLLATVHLLAHWFCELNSGQLSSINC